MENQVQSNRLFNPIEVLSTNYLLKIGQNKCTLAMTRLYHSIFYRIFYITLIFLSFFLLSYMILQLGSYPSERWFEALELFVSFMILLDLSFLVILQGCKGYFMYWSNVIEFSMGLFCVFIAILGLFLDDVIQNIDEGIALVFLVGRNITQFLRLILLLAHLKKTEQTIIDLNEMEDLDEIMQENQRSSAYEEKDSCSQVKSHDVSDSSIP